MNLRHRFAAIAASALVASTLVIGGSAAPSASAANEIFRFETSPGLVRTNLTVDAMDFDPVSGLLYVLSDDGEETALYEIDVDAIEIVRNTVIGSGSAAARDVDVSRDGRTIFVATPRGVHSYVRDDLSEIRFVDLPTAFDVDLLGSPSDPDRFLLSMGDVAWVGIGDDAVLVSGAESADPEQFADVFGPFFWGLGNDEVYAVESDDFLAVSVTNPAVLIDRISAGVTGRKIGGFQSGRMLVGSTLYDPETFEAVHEFETFSVGPAKDGDANFVLRRPSDSGSSMVLVDSDDSSFLREWTMPMSVSFDGWISLNDDRVAYLESANGFEYLTIADPARLATGYGEFTPVTPSRVLDTRSGLGLDGDAGKLGAGSTISVPIAGQGGLPDEGVHAVVMNATVSGATETSFFSIWPSATDRPEVSNLNFGRGQALANSVTVEVGADGAINLSNEFGQAHAVLDVVGYYGDETAARAARYTSVETTRLVDTRPTDLVVGTALGPRETRTFSLGSVDRSTNLGSGRTIVGAALNVTAVRPSQSGFLTVWPGGEQRPTASSLNFAAGDVRANLVIVGVGDGGEVSIYNPFGSVNVLVDVFGVYETFDEPRLDQQGKFLATDPYRSFDSRVSSPFSDPGSLEPNTSLISGNYFGWTDIWNVTAVRPTEDGFLSVLAYGPNEDNEIFPTTSNVNFRAGETVANAVYAPGNPDTETYNPFGRTHVVIDVFGFLTPETQRPVVEVWAPPSKTSEADVSISRSRELASP